MEANRTFLFCPGNHPRKLEKVFEAGGDAVILDLEDAVAVAEKPATRAAVVEALKRPRRCRGYVRVNAYDTEFCYGDLCEIIGPWLDGIVLPKLESVEDMRSVDWLLENLERERGMEIGSVDVMPIIETAKGQNAVRQIAQADTRIRRLSFGAGDYTKDLGMEWSLGETELASMRAEMVMASRLGELEPPVDTVFIHIREHDAFRASCDLVRDLGFQGKMCIHPDQVPVANVAFTPTEEQLAFAHKVIEAFAEAEAKGSASIQIDGYFVDYPIVDKAKRIIDLGEAIAQVEAV
ncbi:MAG: Citrate lyase subunit beta [Alphaproteobacteria bacterium MarineAlpha4_Bin2]|nr:MAG: Citrate lyase subunit beta [Alphaproteobacteria bacterium MarineAlpha4_Bin2]